MENKDEGKLDWMYKGATSLVNREEYLLGRSVDKTLDQINAEEKKIILPVPKNHVEHECIPPSIRDFNKIVQAEQVDLSAKLQEDPLVAIKKREEEARRQFLQNPVQLKKLQEALKVQQEKKKKKKRSKCDDSDELDSKITEKLRLFKHGNLDIPISNKLKKRTGENCLDTILMHKFNALKDKLSEKDLKDILNGNSSSSSDSDAVGRKEHKRKKRRNSSQDCKLGDKSNSKHKKKYSTESDDDDDEGDIKKRKYILKHKKKDRGLSSEDSNYEENHKLSKKPKRKDEGGKRTSEYYQDKFKYRSSKYKEGNMEDYKEIRHQRKSEENKTKEDSDLERKILEKLRLLRAQKDTIRDKMDAGDIESGNSKRILGPEKPKHLQSECSSEDKYTKTFDSDEGDLPCNLKSFGLVTASGDKIELKQSGKYETQIQRKSKVEVVYKPMKNKTKRLTEEEKEELRMQMVKNAEWRDKQREENVKRYRESDKKEESMTKMYNADFVHKEMLKSTQNSTVETRIKSKLNNIQRSALHMDTNFSKR